MMGVGGGAGERSPVLGAFEPAREITSLGRRCLFQSHYPRPDLFESGYRARYFMSAIKQTAKCLNLPRRCRDRCTLRRRTGRACTTRLRWAGARERGREKQCRGHFRRLIA